MLRAMSRIGQSSTSEKAGRRPVPAGVRGGRACLGCLLGLGWFGVVGAAAGQPVAARSGAPTGARITRSATPRGPTTPQGTTTTDVGPDPLQTTQPSDTSTASSEPAQTTADDGPLVVTMSATPQVVSVGQTVTYTAQVSGAPSGKQVLYHWAFEGGTGTGEQITRTYPDPGDYPVAVTVTVASVAGLSGVADTLTVVVSNTSPSKVHGDGSSAVGGHGSGNGKGGGTGSGSSNSAHAAKPSGKSTAAQGVANPLASQAPSAPAGQQVEGFLLSDAGVPFVQPVSTAPTSTSGSSGGSDAGSAGVGGAAGIGGGIALTIAIVTLGALDERRRISLRNA
jgi:hypothetical protein